MISPTRLSLPPHEMTLWAPEEEDAALIVTFLSAEEATALYAALPSPRPALMSIQGFDWNRDLSPWPAPPVFRGEAPFTGQADAFLLRLTEVLLPACEGAMHLRPKHRLIVGYSLAGLFALYAAFITDLFDALGSVSGSMWYDGLMEFARATPLSANLRRAYFSVGAREKHTRNERMATVEERSRQMAELLAARGITTKFQIHPGNHFVDVIPRLSAALSFLLSPATDLRAQKEDTVP